jgi:hypothetical protein
MPWNRTSKLLLPADETIIWRYMDLPKFLSLLEQKALYFALCDELEDKWEARIHRADFNAWVNCMGPESAARVKEGFDRLHASVAVNCWYRGDEESVAMWTLYTQTQYGIAIRSNIGRLKRALEPSPLQIQIGMVEYRNLDDSSCEPLDPKLVPAQMFLFQKRLCYQHERELRAYTFAPPTSASKAKRRSRHRELPEHGPLVSVDLAELVETVRLGPHFPSWAKALIELALERAHIHPAISESAAFAPPPPGRSGGRRARLASISE